MITLLCTSSHTYTHDALVQARKVPFKVLNYTRALRARSLPRGTYVFGDLDRLGYWELELAGRLYRRLADAGLKVLNDPARVLQRCALLERLHADGHNAFGVWRVEQPARPDRYPVFLRTQSAHRGPLSDLLHDAGEVQAAIDRALDDGVPIRELLLVEYCAEPIEGTLFRKLAVLRVGDRMVTAMCVHEGHWAAKYGQAGVAGAALYQDEFELVRDNRYGELLRPAFEAARIEYGRADFALVGGRPQVYEINTNPHVARIRTHPFPVRPQADAIFFGRLLEAYAGIDTPDRGPPVAIGDTVLAAQRERDRWMTRSRWLP